MISGGGCDDAAAERFFFPMLHVVDASADFERSRWLQILQFQVDLTSKKLGELSRVEKRGRLQIAVDYVSGDIDVFQLWNS